MHLGGLGAGPNCQSTRGSKLMSDTLNPILTQAELMALDEPHRNRLKGLYRQLEKNESRAVRILKSIAKGKRGPLTRTEKSEESLRSYTILWEIDNLS